MQHTPDIDFVLPLDIEDQIREISGRPQAQAGNVQLMCIAGRADCRLVADLSVGVFQRVDEG